MLDKLINNNKLMKEWNFKKNKDLNPEKLTCGSGKKVWWICFKGHEWEATITSRTRGNGCPYCSNQKILAGYNDLETVNPSLALEWNYSKNNGLTPKDISSKSNKKVWWRCKDCNYEWKASVNHRSNGTGCPICSNTKISKSRKKPKKRREPI